MPGIATGSTAVGESDPALPKEVASPGAFRSTSVTESPLRCSQPAQHAPTIPAPITTTFRLIAERYFRCF